MAITWTKDWSGADDGTVLRGVDLQNIQNDLSVVLTTSGIGTIGGAQAFDEDLDTLSNPENVNTANIAFNGSFANFPIPPTPANWTVEGGGTEAVDIVNVRVGDEAYEITSDADGSASRQTIYATIDGIENSYWRGRTVTMTAQVYATAIDNARLQIDDGVTTSESSYHTGTTGFEELSVSHTLSNTATKLDIVLLVDGNALAATFDAVRVNNGAAKWEFVFHAGETENGFGNTFTSVHLTETSAPSTLVSEGAIYTKDVAGQPELFFRSESDGTEIQITNATSVNVTGVGSSVASFLVDGNTSGTGQTDAGVDTIRFDTEVFDTGGDFNTSTFSFTAPQDGLYLFNCTANVTFTSGSAALGAQLELAWTGANIIVLGGTNPITTVDVFYASGSAIINLSTSDVVLAQFRVQDNGNGWMVVGGSRVLFSGSLLS